MDEQWITVDPKKKDEDEWVTVSPLDGTRIDPSKDVIRARTWKDTVSEWGHEIVPPVAGAVAGAAGTAVGGPVTGLVTGGAGWMGGQGAMDWADRNLLGINDTPVPGYGEQLKTAGKDFATGMVAQGTADITGPLAKKVIGGALAPYSEAMTPQRMESVRALEEMGYNVSPGMRTGSRLWSIIERFGRRIPGSAGPMQAIDRKNLQVLIDRRNALLGMGDAAEEIATLNRAINDQAEAFLARQKGLSQATVDAYRRMLQRNIASGQRIESAAAGFLGAARDKSTIDMMRKNAAYDAVEEYIPRTDASGNAINRLTPDSNVVRVARDVIATEEGKVAGRNNRLLTEARKIVQAVDEPQPIMWSEGRPLYRNPDPEGLPMLAPPPRPTMDWQGLQAMKAEFSAAVDDPMRGGMVPGVKGQMTPAGRQWSRLAEAIDDDLRTIADAASPEASGAFQAAKALNARYKNLYGPEAEFWNSIAKEKDPAKLSGIAEIIFTNAETRRLAIELGGEDAVKRLERAYTGNIIRSAIDPVTKGFDPKKMLSMIGNPDKFDQAMLASMWGRDGLQAVKDALRGAVNAEKIPKSVWESLRTEDAVSWLLNTNKPNRIRGVIRMLDRSTVEGLKGQYLLNVLGGEGTFGTKAKALGNLPGEISLGRVSGNLKAADELGKALLPPGDLAKLRQFGEAIKLIGDYHGAGFDPGSGVHLSTMYEAHKLFSNPILASGEWLTRNLMVKGYYSDLLKRWVTRRIISPEQAAAWGGLLERYIGRPGVAAAAGQIAGPRQRMSGAIPLRQTSVSPAPSYPESQKLDQYIQPQPPQDTVIPYEDVTRLLEEKDEEELYQ